MRAVWWVIPAFLWEFLFLIVPAVVLCLSSFKAGSYDFIGSAAHWMIMSRSLLYAVISACFCLAIGYPMAYFIALRAGRFKNVLLVLMGLPFVINILIHIYSWIILLDPQGLIGRLVNGSILYTPWAVFVVMIYCYLPFMVMPLYTALDRLDVRLLEASADLGATSWQTFWHVIVPLTRDGIWSGFFLVLVATFGEFTIPTLMGGGKQLYVGTLISDYFLGARQPATGAGFTIVSSVLLLVIILALYGARRFAYEK